MKLKRITAATALVALLLVTACATHIHTVGSGPAGHEMSIQRQWYVLFGLIPINNVDSKAMAAGAENYQIMTQQNFVDVVISAFTGMVSVNCRTVTVTK
jgi:hypothetical protein